MLRVPPSALFAVAALWLLAACHSDPVGPDTDGAPDIVGRVDEAEIPFHLPPPGSGVQRHLVVGLGGDRCPVGVRLTTATVVRGPGGETNAFALGLGMKVAVWFWEPPPRDCPRTGTAALVELDYVTAKAVPRSDTP